MNFDNFLFRASQAHFLTVGNIGLTESQENRLKELINERDTGVNVNGNKIKWTDTKKNELTKLVSVKENPSLPKTMQTFLRKMYRSEKYGRNFGFTNKFTQKGIIQENEAITNYQNYLNIDGIRVLFTKNEERFKNNYVTGVPDLKPIMFNGKKTGFDTKASWELDTLPFPQDELTDDYEYQNQCYMWLTDSEQWITAYSLVNIHEHGLNNEKLKYFYALNCPSDADDEHFEEYQKKCKELEIRLIFDYDRFVAQNPIHDMVISRDEWMETLNPITQRKGYDLPLKERVVEKYSQRNESKINFLKSRIDISRKFLSNNCVF